MFFATFFTRQGRLRGTGSGVEADVRRMAVENDCLLVEGDWQGHYLPDAASPPVPLAVLTVPTLTAERTLDFGFRVQGDHVTVDNRNYYLDADEPLVVQFDTPGKYELSADLLGFRPSRFTVIVP